jgi:hypothetical protein
LDQKKAENFNFQHTGRDGSFRTWFRGDNTNFNPKQEKMVSVGAVDDWVIEGWKPQGFQIDETSQITAFGSCFAENISNWLAERNYSILTKNTDSKSYVVTCGEGMVNSFVIRQQFEWVFEGKKFEESLWHGYEAESFGYDEDIRQQTADIFNKTDVFILTFGLSEVWYDEVSGGVFWRSIPMDKYDASRHKFRVSTVEENRENILEIYNLIRKHRPDAKIIVTLSPVPLIATFRPVSCISANSVSKSVLRVALDEAMRKVADEGVLHYWPSYEVITDVFRSPFKPDRRHLPRAVLDFIMMQFEEVWSTKKPTRQEMLEHWLAAISAANLISDRVEIAVKDRNLALLDRILKKKKLARYEENEQEIRELLTEMRALWAKKEATKKA